jgi:hypothetical protein
MEARQSKFAIKVLPSLTDFAFLMPIVFLFGRMEGVKTLFADCDTGWHIRTGEWIIAHGWVPFRDVFSFSKAGEPWFAWEWLTDVIFARITGFGGLQALVLFSLLMLSVTFTALFLLVRRKANAVIAVGVTMLAAAASSIHWLARPHLFTLFFLVVFYAALEQVREGRTRIAGVPILAALPAITILWTNLHGGFFTGTLMIGAYGAAEILQSLFSPDAGDRGPALRKARAYLVSAGACLAASLINPYTYHLHVHMASYLRDPWNSQHIMEFLSPTFHHPTAIFFEGMLLLAAATAAWNVRHGRFTEPILMLVWAHGALLAARNIPIFMIAAAPPVAAAIQHWLIEAPAMNVAGWMKRALDRFNHVAGEFAETDAIGRWHIVSALGLALVAALLYAPQPPKKFRSEFDPKFYPAAALATLRSDPAARVFTNDEWGDYLIYSGRKVFVDGRSDFYGDDFENNYIDVLNVKYGWEKTLGRFGVDTILMPPNAPLTGALKESSRWRVVYDDGIALVFRSASANAVVAAAPVTDQGTQVSAADRGGKGRDRKVTKTAAGDQAITETKPKLRSEHNDVFAQSVE